MLRGALEVVAIVAVFLVLVHGVWWVRRVGANRVSLVIAAVTSVLFAAFGLWSASGPQARLALAIIGAALPLEMLAYDYSNLSPERWVWNRLFRRRDRGAR